MFFGQSDLTRGMNDLQADQISIDDDVSQEQDIVLHFWHKDSARTLAPCSIVFTRNGCAHTARNLMIGDIVTNAHGEWDKILHIKK